MWGAVLVVCALGCGSGEEEVCLSATGSGECNVVTQCGCTERQQCFLFCDTTCITVEMCARYEHDLWPGSQREGEPCNAVFHAYPSTIGFCTPGLRCVIPEGELTGTCTRWCRDDGDCRGGSTCSGPSPSLGDCGGMDCVSGLATCTLP